MKPSSLLLSKRGSRVGLLIAGATAIALLVHIGIRPTSPEVQASESREPVGRIGDQTVSSADLEAAVRPQLSQLRLQEYELKRRALDDIIANKLIQAEAATQKLTPDELVRRNAETKVAPATEAEVTAFYEARAKQINGPLSQVKQQIENAVQQAKIQQARQEYVRQLRDKSPVIVLLRPPQTGVAIAEASRAKGPADAPITIVEFSDFQCPFCRNAAKTVQEVARKYGSQVRLAFRDLPLRHLHQNAQMAAEASRCAADQGKFWPYHDLLFANQANLDRSALLQHARTANLNGATFQSCLDSGKHKDAVEKDVQEAQAAGVSGTPAFFINGVLLKGDVPASAFEKVIEEELAYVRYQNSCNQTCESLPEETAKR
jgi:protein-disulfide isomerase